MPKHLESCTLQFVNEASGLCRLITLVHNTLILQVAQSPGPINKEGRMDCRRGPYSGKETPALWQFMGQNCTVSTWSYWQQYQEPLECNLKAQNSFRRLLSVCTGHILSYLDLDVFEIGLLWAHSICLSGLLSSSMIYVSTCLKSGGKAVMVNCRVL